MVEVLKFCSFYRTEKAQIAYALYTSNLTSSSAFSQAQYVLIFLLFGKRNDDSFALRWGPTDGFILLRIVKSMTFESDLGNINIVHVLQL